MKRLPFVLWMIGFPLVAGLWEYVDVRFGSIEKSANGMDMLLIWGIWISVGILLWKDAGRNGNKTEGN